jgi:anti-sigma-K factor RskA
MDELHDLTAGYALDALDAEERRAYEAHLSGCSACQEELASFWEVTGSLAYASARPAPSPELRGRLLDAARAERPNVVPLRPRRLVVPVLSTVAAVAAVVAIGLGLWASSLSSQLDDARAVSAVLGDPGARAIALQGADGRLVVDGHGRAVLMVEGLPEAPSGKAYEVWVIQDGRPDRAGMFQDERLVTLDRMVPRGSTVAVTVEDEGGVDAPTGQPIFSAPVA